MMDDMVPLDVAPSMLIAELRQKVTEWYREQEYSDHALASAMCIIDSLCVFLGTREMYSPQIGQDFLDSLAERHMTDSTFYTYNRVVYVLNCLTFDTSVRVNRKSASDLIPFGYIDDGTISKPMDQLLQMVNENRIGLISNGRTFVLNDICRFIGSHVIYTQKIGQMFLDYECKKEGSERYIRRFKRVVYILDCLLTNEPIQTRHHDDPVFAVPSGFLNVFSEYISHCENQGNRKGTIYLKQRYVSQFLSNLESCGCHEISDLSPKAVQQAGLVPCPPGAYSCYNNFLKYLAEEEISTVDYSPLIPCAKRKTKLPDVYSKDEILGLEASYDRSTVQGKRDYAIVLMASRLKLRPSDIVTLQFDELDFDCERIQFTQVKTDDPLGLPMLPEVKEALSDYIEVRPKSDSPYVFLRLHAPYLPLHYAAIHHVTTVGFKNADVDPDGRETGPRSLRSSGATHMINSGKSYKVVSDSLGHKSKNVIQHYARLDVEHLRQCAGTPPRVTEGSYFDRILNGKILL